MTLAEFGVNLDWTNAEGMNMAQHIQAITDPRNKKLETSRGSATMDFNLLEEAMQLNRTKRAC